jgi:hypothetical protein
MTGTGTETDPYVVDYPLWDLSTSTSASNAKWTYNGGVTYTNEGIWFTGDSESYGKSSDTGNQISGNYKVQFTITFAEDYESSVMSGTSDGDDGLYFYPLYGSSAITNGTTSTDVDGYRVIFTPDKGLRVGGNTNTNGYTEPTGENYTKGENILTSLKVGTPYNFILQKQDDTIKVKMWEAGTTKDESDWDIIHTISGISDGTHRASFRIAKGTKTVGGVTVSDLIFTKQAEITVSPIELTDTVKADIPALVWGGDAFAEGALPALTVPTVTYSSAGNGLYYLPGGQIAACNATDFPSVADLKLAEKVDGNEFKTYVNANVGNITVKIPVTVYPACYVEHSDGRLLPFYTVQKSIDSETANSGAIDLVTNGSTITLLRDVAGSLSVPEGRYLNLDLNSFKVNGATTVNGTLNVVGSGELDVLNLYGKVNLTNADLVLNGVMTMDGVAGAKAEFNLNNANVTLKKLSGEDNPGQSEMLEYAALKLENGSTFNVDADITSSFCIGSNCDIYFDAGSTLSIDTLRSMKMASDGTVRFYVDITGMPVGNTAIINTTYTGGFMPSLATMHVRLQAAV